MNIQPSASINSDCKWVLLQYYPRSPSPLLGLNIAAGCSWDCTALLYAHYICAYFCWLVLPNKAILKTKDKSVVTKRTKSNIPLQILIKRNNYPPNSSFLVQRVIGWIPLISLNSLFVLLVLKRLIPLRNKKYYLFYRKETTWL